MRQRSLLPTFAVVVAVLGAALGLDGLLAGRWMMEAAIAVVAVVATGEICRRLSAPRALIPLLEFVVLGLVMVIRFAGDLAIGHVVPTAASISQLSDLLTTGREDIARLVPPVPVSPGLLLLVVLGTGIVAICVDTRALTYGGAGLAAIPLLCLYGVPALAAPDGADGRGFLIAASGYLLLLFLDRQQRLGGWGRLVTAGDTDGRSAHLARPSSPSLAFGIVVPVLLALLLPAAVPALSDGVLGNGDAGPRDRTVPVVNPILSLREDLTRARNIPLMTYRPSDGDGRYIRLVGLDKFSGDSWETSKLQVSENQQVNDGMDLVGVAPETPRESVSMKVGVGALHSRWLPLPYPASKVDTSDSWLYDRDTYNVFSTKEWTDGRSYTADWVDVQPTAEQLRNAPAPPAELNRFLELPDDLPRSIQARTDEFSAGQNTQYDKAVALQGWLKSFKYDERAPDATSSSAIADFLARRRGFCVHFASALAVMARQLGIPARVAVGFLPGTETNGVFTVSSHDAHAWTELYFAGAGWVKFDATPGPRVDTSPEPGTSPPAVSPLPEPSTEVTADPTGSPSAQPSPSRGPLPGQSTPVPPAGGGSSPAWGLWLSAIGAALLVALALSAPALAKVYARRRRWRVAASGPRQRAETAVEQFRLDCLDYAVPWRASETPRQFAARLSEVLGQATVAAAAAARLAGLAERLRYSPQVGEISGVRHDVVLVRDGLAEVARTSDRLRADWLPPSVLLPLGMALSSARQRLRGWFGRLRPAAAPPMS